MTAYLRNNINHSVSNRNEPFKALTCRMRSYLSIRRSPVVWDGVEVFVLCCCSLQTIVNGIYRNNDLCEPRVTSEMRGSFCINFGLFLSTHVPMVGTYCMNTKEDMIPRPTTR